MKNRENYEPLNIKVAENDRIPKGKDIYYKCLHCGDITICHPKDSWHCTCRNIIIDADYIRLVVKDYSQFQVLKKISE